jgi:hypothetical protein
MSRIQALQQGYGALAEILKNMDPRAVYRGMTEDLPLRASTHPANIYKDGMYWSSLPQGAIEYSKDASGKPGALYSAIVNSKKPFFVHDDMPAYEMKQMLSDAYGRNSPEVRQIIGEARGHNPVFGFNTYTQLDRDGFLDQSNNFLKKYGYDTVVARGPRLNPKPEKYTVVLPGHEDIIQILEKIK